MRLLRVLFPEREGESGAEPAVSGSEVRRLRRGIEALNIHDVSKAGRRAEKLVKAVLSGDPHFVLAHGPLERDLADFELREYATLCLTNPDLVCERQRGVLAAIAESERRFKGKSVPTRLEKYEAARSRLNNIVNNIFGTRFEVDSARL